MIRFRRQLQNVHDAMEAREQAHGQHGFGQPALPTSAASMVYFFSGCISSQDKAVQQLALMLVFTAFKFFEGAKVSVWAIAKADIFDNLTESTSFDPVTHRMVKRIDIRPLEIKILTFLDFEVGRTPAVVYFDEAMAVAHRQPSLWFDTDHGNNLTHRIADILHCCTAQNWLESFDDQVRSWLTTLARHLRGACCQIPYCYPTLLSSSIPGSISGDGCSSVRSVICFVRIEGTTHPPHRIVLSAARFALCRSRLPSEGDQHAAAYHRPW